MVDNEAPLSQNKATDEGKNKKKALEPKFWLAQLSLSKRSGDDYIKDSDDAWLEFLGKRGSRMSVKQSRTQSRTQTKFPIFWSTVKTIQPALYSKTPTIMSERMLDEEEDQIARLGTIYIERLGKYLIKACPFDRVQYATRDDYILTGKATNRVCFYDDDYGQDDDSEEEQEPNKHFYSLMPLPDGSQVLVDDNGAPPPPGMEVQQEEDGTYFVIEPENAQEKATATLEPVSYKDIRHNPDARHWEEVDWVSFRLYLNKSDVKKRFGDEIAELIPYSSGEDKKKRGTVEAHDRDNNYAAIWETWDRESNKVYFLCEGYDENFLEEPQDDPYGLPGFFPCPPFMLGTCETDSLYPIPDFIQLRPLIEQIHAIADRLRINIRATKKRGLYDNAVEELKNLNTDTSDAEFLGVSNFQALISKGGLQNLVQFFPTGEIAELVQQLQALLDAFSDWFLKSWGIPDILTGSSDPEETAEAQKLKQKNVGTRFKAIVREFQRLIRDDIEILCDVALAKFSDARLAEIMGVKYDKPENQQVFPQVLALLRQFDERAIRINIQTDSTTLSSELDELERRQGLMTMVMQSFTQLLQIGNGQPAVMKVGLELILYTIRSMPDGKQIEDELSQAIQAMLQPPPPPQPDPKIAIEQGKLQLQGQALQQKGQTEQGWMQIETQKNQSDIQIKQLEAQLKVSELKLEQQEQSFRQQLDSFKAKMDQMQTAGKITTDKADSDRENFKNKLDAAVATAQIKQEKVEMELDHTKALHEIALAHNDQKLRMAEMIHNARQTGVEVGIKNNVS